MAMSKSTSMSTAVVAPATLPEESEVPPAKEKRRRAGKPKVRTGCITCKIRRIKCDEQKPACQRCISTGRTCDGYKIVGRSKSIRRPGFAQQLSPSPSSTNSNSSSSANTSTSLPMLRPLATAFSGDAVERQYIHRFLPIAEDIVGIPHVHNSFFWGHVVPEYCFTSGAVRHATIALSSAYHSYWLSERSPGASGPPSTTESYIIMHYNQSLNKIAEELNGLHVRKSYGLTLICCMSFFYIEILRGDWGTAMMHLVNGIRLMSNMPVEIEEVFQHPKLFSQDHDNTLARAIYITKLLRRWEGSAAFIQKNSLPSLSLQAYDARKTDATVPKAFESLAKIQEIVDDFYQDVNAFGWMCRQYNGDSSTWDYAAARLQYDVLQQRSYHVGRLLEKGKKTYGELEHAPKASEFLTFQGCLLRHQGASIVLDHIPLPRHTGYTPPEEDADQFEEIIKITDIIKTALRISLGLGASPWFNVDFGVVSTLYIVASNCRTTSTRERLFVVLKTWPWREDLWDGPLLRQHLYDSRILPATTTSSSTKPPLLPMPSPRNLVYRSLSPPKKPS